MSDFLSKILEHKKQEVQAAERLVPEKALRRLAEKSDGRRSFSGRMASPGPFGMNVISEIKRASPSKGMIRDRVDPGAYAQMYERGGAAAISVLTEKKFFHGDPVDLREARGAAALPVLRKDFIILPYQVYESAAIGADAVLLIVRALSTELLHDLISLCAELGMDALVEVHDEPELQIAMFAGAKVIGVNNRDLVTFKTDIQTSIDLSGVVGPEHVLVSESGIRARSDIERLLEAGVFNFLIGESLMRSEDPEKCLKDLHGVTN